MTATRPSRVRYARDLETVKAESPAAPGEAVDVPTMPVASRPPPEGKELLAVIDEFIQAAEDGEAWDAYGEQYTPEGLRKLQGALSLVKSELGTMHVQAIRRWHIQGMLDELRRDGFAPARLTAVVEALDSLYTHAIARGLVDDSPVIWITFPQQGESVERVPASAAQRPAPPPAPETEGAAATTPTGAMVALGSRVLLWTVRATVTIFVLVVIALLVGFA